MINFHLHPAVASALLSGAVAFLFGTGIFMVARAYIIPAEPPAKAARDALPPEVTRPPHARGDRKGRRGRATH